MNASSDDLKKILELTKLLNSSRDVKYILDEMMHETLSIIKRADIAVIFLYNKDTNKLESMTSVGFGDVKFTLEPNESITGITFTSQKPLHLKTKEEMTEAMASLKKSTKKRLVQECVYPIATLQSSISCPLIYNKECIGVFVLDNFDSKPPMTEDDMYLAEMISVNATIAIINASNYKQMHKEKDRYAYSTYLHNKFTDMVLNGESINDIINEVSIMRDKDIFVFDRYYKTTHYSDNNLYDQDIVEDAHKRFIEFISPDKVSTHYDKANDLWILYNPIRVNESLFGWVAVISSKNDFPELEIIAINKCSTIVALEILKNEELLSMEQSLKGDFLENLISGESTKIIEKFSARYGYNFDNPHQLIIMKFDVNDVDEAHIKKLRYLYKKIRGLNQSFFFNSITIQKQNYIITIYDCSQEIDRNQLDKLIRKYKEQVSFIKNMANIDFYETLLISEEINGDRTFKEVYQQTMKIFNLDISKKNSFNYYYYADLEVKRFLLANPKEDLEQFVIKTLGPLLAYPKSSKSELYNTLKIYTKSGANWTATKKTMHIHGNTLTYRINRLKEILGYDLNEYYFNLRLKIAFEIIELYPELSIKA